MLRDPPTLIDLRAPVEYVKGSAPGAINLPILTDRERHQVGLCYRERGQEAAIALGQQLVQGAVQQARTDGWQRLLERDSDAVMFCWRGGQRTRFAAEWLTVRGLQPACVQGGYKAIRTRCLQILEEDSQRIPWLILGGQTGVGKTVLIGQTRCSLDLEGLARHRGSAFGGTAHPQPSQVNFENQLAAAALRLLDHHAQMVLEDESRTIGKVALPASWHQRMQSAPLVLLEASPGQRAAHIAREYVWQPLAAGGSARALLAKYRHSVYRIRKRLGSERTGAINRALTASFEAQRAIAPQSRSALCEEAHAPWINLLLDWYYDPMYDYQLSKKAHRIVFRGNAEAVSAWLETQVANHTTHDARG